MSRKVWSAPPQPWGGLLNTRGRPWRRLPAGNRVAPEFLARPWQAGKAVSLKKLGMWSLSRHHAKILGGPAGGHAAPGGALQEAGLDQVGFVNVFQGAFLLAQSRGQGAQAHRPAVVCFQDGEEDQAVHAV